MTTTARLTLKRGSLHFDKAVYDEHFAPLSGLVLLRDGPELLVMPVRLAGAGGHLIKVRNLAGDRVVDAADFFRIHGVDDAAVQDLTASWSEDRGALITPFPSSPARQLGNGE